MRMLCLRGGWIIVHLAFGRALCGCTTPFSRGVFAPKPGGLGRHEGCVRAEVWDFGSALSGLFVGLCLPLSRIRPENSGRGSYPLG